MNIPLNSARARDIAAKVHPQTNLLKHSEEGAMVVESGQGIYVKDDDGNEYIETISGLVPTLRPTANFPSGVTWSWSA